MDNLEERIVKLEAAISDVAGALVDLDNRIGKRISTMGKNFFEVIGKLENLDERVDILEEDTYDLRNDYECLEGRVSELE